MINQHIFESKDLPENFKLQILCFLRIVWPDGFMGENRLRDWISSEEDHPVYLLLEENGILISQLAIVWKNLEHQGETYKACGLTGILTYPAFRNQGYGLRLLNEAKKYIESKGDADIVIFHSTLKGYYEKAGFTPMPNLITLKGNRQNPETSDETAFMLFLSEKGIKNRKNFELGELYFGEDTW